MPTVSVPDLVEFGLRRGDLGGARVFPMGEAHNLVDRSREMSSADLNERKILDVKRAAHCLVTAYRKKADVQTLLVKFSAYLRHASLAGAQTLLPTFTGRSVPPSPEMPWFA